MATKKTHEIWMPLYIADYLADTMALSTEQHGAYLLLLMHAWKSEGRLPGDSARLGQIARMQPQSWARTEPVLRDFFEVTADGWIHKRVSSELERAKDRVEKRSAAGKVAAAKKWGLRVV